MSWSLLLHPTLCRLAGSRSWSVLRLQLAQTYCCRTVLLPLLADTGWCMQAIVDALSEWLRQDWLQDASDVLNAVTALLELPAAHVRAPASVWSLATLCSTSDCLSAPACRMAAAAIRSGASIPWYLTQLYGSTGLQGWPARPERMKFTRPAASSSKHAQKALQQRRADGVLLLAIRGVRHCIVQQSGTQRHHHQAAACPVQLQVGLM